MILYKIMKASVHSLDGDTDFFDIVSGFLQGDILAQYSFIICQDNIFWTLLDLVKENGFTLKKQEAETITDTNYANDQMILANTPTQPK